MRKTKYNNTENPITVTIDQLQKMLNCGYYTAKRIGEKAKARVYSGRRTLYNVEKIKEYLRKISI